MTAVTPSREALEPCPFCGKPLYVSRNKINPSARCMTDNCYGTRMSVVNLDDPVCVAAWNTRADSPQPTRDAAEGADPCPYCKKEMHGADDCENCGMGSPARPTRFVTPKSAPDAVRLTDRELYDNSCITRHQLKNWVDSDYVAHIGGLKHTIEFLLARLDANSAAPVPSPDGAGEIEAALRFAFPHFEGGESITAETIRQIGKEHVDMITGWEPQKDEIEFLDHQGNVHKIIYDPGEDHVGLAGGWSLDIESDLRAPSATGAAEPDTYRCDKRNCFYPECDCRKLATPPVRRDRKLLEQCAKIAQQFELDMSSSQLDDRDIENIKRGANEASSAIEQAILSLPVQPGAGERDLIKNAFYEGFELGRGNQSPDDFWPHSEAKAAGEEL